MNTQRVETPTDVSFFHTLHTDCTGIIALATINPNEKGKDRFKCDFGRYHTIKKKVEAEAENIYFSLNTFRKFSRRVENICELTSCYLDIDYYNTEYTKEQILGNIDILIEDGDIPVPTFIVDSGRGLYLIWHLKRLPREALPTWRTFQEYLYNQLKDFGADRKSLDAARIFRVDNSINTKNNKKVQVLSYYPVRYDLHQLEKNYIPDLYAYKQNMKRGVSKPKHKKGSVLYYFNNHSLYYNRMIDLARLCELRNYDLEPYHCREQILFLYRYYACCYSENPEQGLEDMLELNALFKDPLPEYEVIRATRSAEKAFKTRKYNYRNQTLIDLLGIDADEQTFMKVIIGKEEKYTRNNVKRKAKRRTDAGFTIKDIKRLETIDTILDLKAKGMIQKEVAKLTGLSIRTIKSYWKIEKERVNMWYKILVGKRKGEIILIGEVLKGEGVAITTEGERLRLDQIAPLTEKEKAQCLQEVPIDLNA